MNNHDTSSFTIPDDNAFNEKINGLKTIENNLEELCDVYKDEFTKINR